MVKLFVAAKAFINLNDKILVIKESSRYKDGTQVGRFDVIGGRINPEQPIEANLRREIEEETGIRDIKIGKPFFVNEVSPIINGEQTKIIRIFFECFIESDKIILSEDHDEFKWISPNNYKQENLIENLHEVFEAYLNIFKLGYKGQ